MRLRSFKGSTRANTSISITPITAKPKNPSDVTATVEYGLQYACSVQRENIFGVQFHPEKSQALGLQILKNFLEVE